MKTYYITDEGDVARLAAWDDGPEDELICPMDNLHIDNPGQHFELVPGDSEGQLRCPECGARFVTATIENHGVRFAVGFPPDEEAN